LANTVVIINTLHFENVKPRAWIWINVSTVILIRIRIDCVWTKTAPGE
jgi:hypothetical protein